MTPASSSTSPAGGTKTSRLSEVFAARSKCFIPFVTAGHPDLETTREIVLELAAAGSDIVEIGIPFSDPIADGPVIQRSSFEALKHGYSISDYIDLVQSIRAQSDIGLIFMTYLNPVLRFGLSRLDQEAHQAGLDGILISDLTPEEAPLLEEVSALDTVFLAAPTSSDRRIQAISRCCRGFLYLVARTGVTGAHSDLNAQVPATIERIRRFTPLPVAVGFGIQSAADVLQAWEHAEGAIVGSAIVQFIEEHKDEPGLALKVGDFVKKRLIPPR